MKVEDKRGGWLDRQWEKDVALSTDYRLPTSLIAIGIGVLFFVMVFEVEQAYTIHWTIEQMEWPRSSEK